jgi:DNA-binding NtrC family response regulator
MKSLRVLIAEDDPPVATMLSDILGELGYEVIVVVSLEQVVQVATHVRPHIVLVGLDGHGNFAPGWQAAMMLANLLPGIPLVMIATSDPAVEEAGKTVRSRAFAAALLKPFPIDKLTSIIDSLCSDSDNDMSSADTMVSLEVIERPMERPQEGVT